MSEQTVSHLYYNLILLLTLHFQARFALQLRWHHVKRQATSILPNELIHIPRNARLFLKRCECSRKFNRMYCGTWPHIEVYRLQCRENNVL